MIIKSISLKNFRQYIDTTIRFATEPEKNVTVMMGDNGTGKTTLAQSFQWALYGTTSFQIKELINRQVREQMKEGEKVQVSVTLNIQYNNRDYTIKRSVDYRKLSTERIEERPPQFSMCVTGEDGQVEYLSEGQKRAMINNFLPEDLSQFFFFDGERIERMSKEILEGKSEDFKEAVYSLVGLKATQNAIGHLKSSRNGNSVVKFYRNELNQNNASNEKMRGYERKIEDLTNDIAIKDKLYKEKQEQKEECKRKIEECREIIHAEADTMRAKEQYLKLEREIERLKKEKKQKIGNDLLKEFNRGIFDFCIKPLVEEGAENIKEEEAAEKSIPDLTSKLLIYLMNERKKCLCGRELCEDSQEYKELKGLLNFAEPKSIGSKISEYRIRAGSIVNQKSEFMQDIKRKLGEIERIQAQIEGCEQELGALDELVGKTSKGESAKAQKAEFEAELRKLEENEKYIFAALEIKTKEKNRIEKEMSSLLIVNDSSKKTATYLEYASRLYEHLRKEYNNNENKYRFLLQQRMNEIFRAIYAENIKISIEEQYRITVNVQEEFSSMDEVEKNTAQGYALIFAFISAIIDLAKKKVNDRALFDEDMIDVEKEGYPLVMDAPLSAFDKTRIKSICTEIPKIANQVIIFIKDTDGEVAEEHMSERIGQRYLLKKYNDSNLHSVVEER